MKTIYLLIILLLSSIFMFSQDISLKYNPETGLAEFQEVISVDGKSATELYNLAQKWVINTYRNPDEVIVGDIEGETIKGSGYQRNVVVFTKTPRAIGDWKYSFKVDFKDNKARFTIFDMKCGTGLFPIENYLYKSNGELRKNAQARNVLESITVEANTLYVSFKSAILQLDSNDTDW